MAPKFNLEMPRNCQAADLRALSIGAINRQFSQLCQMGNCCAKTRLSQIAILKEFNLDNAIRQALGICLVQPLTCTAATDNCLAIKD